MVFPFSSSNIIFPPPNSSCNDKCFTSDFRTIIFSSAAGGSLSDETELDRFTRGWVVVDKSGTEGRRPPLGDVDGFGRSGDLGGREQMGEDTIIKPSIKWLRI
jgi:hypothetical protein